MYFSEYHCNNISNIYKKLGKGNNIFKTILGIENGDL
jgi:hypothetical protein